MKVWDSLKEDVLAKVTVAEIANKIVGIVKYGIKLKIKSPLKAATWKVDLKNINQADAISGLLTKKTATKHKLQVLFRIRPYQLTTQLMLQD